MKRPLVLLAVAAFLGLGVLYALPFFWSGVFCYTPPKQAPDAGSQGYRIWFGDSLKSFEHQDRKVCVPEGFEAVGAVEIGAGWAKFDPGMTGVLVRSDAFASELLEPKESSYSVRLLYSIGTDANTREQYARIVENAFNRVGGLFERQIPPASRLPHTVLVTAGVAGDTRSGHTRVYPDPRASLSIFMRTPENPRAEELFIHAVMHLYNRHRTDLTAHQESQAPFGVEDWQELEATWSETALTTSDRLARLSYLYNVHTAVRTGNFSLITSPPFNDEEAFRRIRQSAIVDSGSETLDYQYGHYVLAPLSMLAVEGLLREFNPATDMEDILREIHRGEGVNFFDELEVLLPPEQMERVRGWFEGKKTIPTELIQAAAVYYGPD